MGEVVVSEFISLDGVMEDPGGAEDSPFGGWTFRFSAEEGQRLKYDELMAADVQLLGRVTYEEFAANWPAMEDAAGDFGAKMNAMPKVVVSTPSPTRVGTTPRSRRGSCRTSWPD